MIDRVACGLLPAKLHTQLRTSSGELLYEEMFTRGGFAGAFSAFYHRYPITAAQEVRATSRGHAVPRADEGEVDPLKRRLYQSGELVAGGTLLDCRVPLLHNRDVAVYFARPTASCDVYFANGDGDELWFVQEGEGALESPCGMLDVRAGDYVFVPRSLQHRWHWREGSVRMLGFEAHGGLFIPAEFRNPTGQLRLDAPYSHRDFVRPTGPIASLDRDHEGPSELVVKKSGRFTSLLLERCPMDVVGWDGFVYPFAFAIEKYQPKTGSVHLPPTIHTTFEGRGFLVCSFVPRLVDSHPLAIPCPYPHSSADCDEIILYLRGNFTSRRGVGPGAISWHPAGIAHGPHPGAYEASIGTTRTDELAVMMDCFEPLVPTPQARSIELVSYHDSWRTR